MNIIMVNKELTEVVGSRFSFFDLGPRLGDLYQPLVKHKYTTFNGQTMITLTNLTEAARSLSRGSEVQCVFHLVSFLFEPPLNLY